MEREQVPLQVWVNSMVFSFLIIYKLPVQKNARFSYLHYNRKMRKVKCFFKKNILDFVHKLFTISKGENIHFFEKNA